MISQCYPKGESQQELFFTTLLWFAKIVFVISVLCIMIGYFISLKEKWKEKFMNAAISSYFLSCINVSLKQNATLDLGFSQRGQQRSSKSILGYEVIFCQLRLSNVLHLKIAH